MSDSYRALVVDMIEDAKRTIMSVGGPHEDTAMRQLSRWTTRLAAMDGEQKHNEEEHGKAPP
jgi:hypothetical protein